MATVLATNKPLSASPLKLSAPLGAAMAFLGLDECLPLFHGSQGCTAFAMVMMVRHFREAIPLQTTAMNEIATILGGMDHVEQALLNIAERAKPKVIGLVSTALVDTRGEDMAGDLPRILERNRALDGVAVIPVSAPDFEGSLETGWSKAVTAMVAALAEKSDAEPLDCVTLLPGCHLTPGDVEHLKDVIEAFGLIALALPDLSGSLDGVVPGRYVPTTLGGLKLDEARAKLGRAKLTIAVGEHMRPAAEALAAKTGVPFVLLDRLTGLEAVDRLMVTLSTASGRPVPARLRRQRDQLVDAMLDGHFFFGGQDIAVAGEPDFLWSMGQLISEMGGHLAAAVSPIPAPFLADLTCDRVMIGDFEDLEDQMLEAGGVDLVIANANARQLCRRHSTALFRAGFPVFDRLGAAHQTSVGYRGTRDLIFQLGNMLMDHHS